MMAKLRDAWAMLIVTTRTQDIKHQREPRYSDVMHVVVHVCAAWESTRRSRGQTMM